MNNTMLQFDLHDHVRKALDVSGLSSGEFAEQMGVSRNTVSRWINGRAVPTKAQRMAIAIVLDVPLAWLEEAAERPPAEAEGLARPKGLEPLTFCSVADDELEVELAFYAIVEAAHV